MQYSNIISKFSKPNYLNQSHSIKYVSPLNSDSFNPISLFPSNFYSSSKKIRNITPLFGFPNFFKNSKRITTISASNISRNIKSRNYSTKNGENIRNIAIIAHVDHGKTTMVDALLKQSGTLKEAASERVMDSNALEKERGITILSKITSMKYKDYKINLVDTPGHGDFGGEVERIMGMVDGVILVVDASEGPMAQTKFVLTKALRAGLRPIVVINKMDRKMASRVEEVEEEIFDLFTALEASEKQMEYPTLYASGRAGWVMTTKDGTPKDMAPLFDAIVNYIHPPKINPMEQFSMLVSTLETDPYLGRILTGRVHSGSVKVSKLLRALDINGKPIEDAKVLKIVSRDGLERKILDEAVAGDIVGIAGFTKASVSSTICDPEVTTSIPTIPLDPPVISIKITCNTSPIAGREGTQNTFPLIKRRLEKEAESNISVTLKSSSDGSEALELCGRGELQLGIVIENMRREGFEFSVSPPQVVFMIDKDGQKLEPIEEVTIDVDEDYTGVILERMNNRKGELQEMKEIQGKMRMIFRVPSRALVGFRNELLTQTKGTAVYNHLFHSYEPYKGKLGSIRKGSLISSADGVSTSYALAALEPRGVLFIGPQIKIYEGMVVGEHTRENDLDINPCKAKQLTNIRAPKADENIRLTPPKLMSLEEFMAYCRSDQLLEITPQNIRLRMSGLKPNDRKKRSDD